MPGQRGSVRIAVSLFALLFLAGLTLVLVLWLSDEPVRQAREAQKSYRAPARLIIQRVGPGEAPVEVRDIVQPSDKLGFAYENHAGKTHLLVFGLDEHGGLIWFIPRSESETGGDERSILIERGPGRHELPGTHTLRVHGNMLRLCGIFTSKPVTTREVADLVHRPRTRLGLLPIRGAIQDVHVLDIRP
jgi:hypothetical protein